MTNVTEQQVSSGKRLLSMILDHLIMTLIAMIFLTPLLIKELSFDTTVSHELPRNNTLNLTTILGLLAFAIYFCKDCVGGQSIAKRILKLQIVSNSTEQVASPIRCLIRNIFTILWPIEGIVALFNPSRRIGDYVAGTKLVALNQKNERVNSNPLQILISLLLALALSLVVLLLFQKNETKSEEGNVDYIENSFNEKVSNEISQRYNDSTFNWLTADIKVYDKIKDEDMKFVSAIFYLKDDHFSSDVKYNQMENMILPILLEKFEERTYVAHIQYVYKTVTTTTTKSFFIDWRRLNKVSKE